MKKLEDFLRKLDLEYFGNSKHKMQAAKLFETDGALLLDVRTHEENRILPLKMQGVIEAINIPMNELPDRLDEISKNRVIGLFCSSQVRSSIAFGYLQALGFENVRILEGGYASLLEELKPGKVLKSLSSK